MSIAYYKNQLKEFNQDNILTPDQEEFMRDLLVQAYVAGSEDGLLDMFLPLFMISRDIQRSDTIQQLSTQELDDFNDWLTTNDIIEQYRSKSYDVLEEFVQDTVSSYDLELSEMQENIVQRIIKDYFNDSED